MIDGRGVSVVLCARNEQERIGRQLEALARQAPPLPWEVVVVDNGSRDATAAVASGFRDRLDLRVVHEARPGVSCARNLGVATARYPLLAHCDADDEVGERWLASLVEGLERHALVTGSFDETALRGAHGRSMRPPMPTHAPPVAHGFLPYAVGANMAYRREVHRRIGGWDEAFRFGGGDDVDFSWRALHAGFELGFCPDAVVRYRHRSSQLQGARQIFRYAAADPLLYRRHARHGMTRPDFEKVRARWLELLTGTPGAARDARRRAQWLATLSWSAGRLRGSLRHRTLFL